MEFKNQGFFVIFFKFFREDEDTVPDVPAAVQEMLLNLFTSVYNHQDEEGR